MTRIWKTSDCLLALAPFYCIVEIVLRFKLTEWNKLLKVVYGPHAIASTPSGEPRRKSLWKLKIYGPSDINSWTTGVIHVGVQNLVRQFEDMSSNQLIPSMFGELDSDPSCCVHVVLVSKLEIKSGLRSIKCMDFSVSPRFFEISYCGGMADGFCHFQFSTLSMNTH